MEDNTKHTKFWNASNRVWNKILWILMKIGKKNGFYGEEAGESILLQSQNSSEICFIPQVVFPVELYSGESSTWDGLYILYWRCVKNPVITLLLRHLKPHNKYFFWLLTGQTPASGPPKTIIEPFCMTEILAVFAFDICKFISIFDWLLFHDRVWSQSQKDSEYI